MGKVYIGTSGYNYKHWSNGVFYPKGLSQNKWLEYYCKYFNTVELNVTFYRLPKKKTFENWYKRTPDDFVYIAKGSRYTTHIKRLKDPEDTVNTFFESASGLKGKLEMVLWQLPPSFKLDRQRLINFCKAIRKVKPASKVKHAFEFRNEEWFTKSTYDILKKFNHALCIAHSSNWPCVEEITADFVYLRLHGEELYSSNYPDKELKKWADKINKWLRQVKDIYVYFNNDAKGYAVRNALKLKELTGS